MGFSDFIQNEWFMDDMARMPNILEVLGVSAQAYEVVLSGLLPGEVATPITLGGALALGMHQQEVLPDGRENSEWNDRDSERSIMRSLVRLNSRLVFFEDRRQAIASKCTNT
jgi:hypothetical protein